MQLFSLQYESSSDHQCRCGLVADLYVSSSTQPEEGGVWWFRQSDAQLVELLGFMG